MTAITTERATPSRDDKFHSDPVAANTKVLAGALACLDASGNLTNPSAATTLIARGRVRATVDNTGGAAGDLSAETEAGTFRWENSAAGDAITRAEIGDDCYMVDNQTVAKTDGTGTRSKAGRIVDVDSSGVWVETR